MLIISFQWTQNLNWKFLTFILWPVRYMKVSRKFYIWRVYCHSQAYWEHCQTSEVFFWENSWRLSTVNYFRNKLHLRCLTGFSVRLCHCQTGKNTFKDYCKDVRTLNKISSKLALFCCLYYWPKKQILDTARLLIANFKRMFPSGHTT